MDLFNLQAVLGINTNPLTKGLAAAKGIVTDYVGWLTSFAVNGMQDAIQTGMSFDSAMSSVRAVLGEEEGSLERMEELRAFALDQARESVFTAEEAANAYYYMGMAGWKSEQMLAGLPGIMALAAASGEDLARTSDIVTDSLTAFGWSADDTKRYVDILAQTARSSNTNVSMMGEAFKYAAPLAGAMKFSVEDTALAISLMASQGIKASQAGTTLRRIFSGITGPIKITGERLGDVTVQTTNADGSMRGLWKIMADLRAAFSQLTEAEKISAAESIAGKYAMSGFLAMMNSTTDQVDQLQSSINNAKGAAQEMADVRLDNLAGDIDLFNSELYNLKIAIYDGTNGPLRDAVQWGTEALRDITDAIGANGLQGGLDMLEIQIEQAGKKFGPVLKSIGEAAAPVLEGLLDVAMVKLPDTAFELGGKLGEGLMNGIAASLPENSFVGSVAGLIGHMLGTDMSNGTGGLTSGNIGLMKEVRVEKLAIDDAEISPQTIQDAVDNAQIVGGTTRVTINGIEMDEAWAEQLLREMEAAGEIGGEDIAGKIQENINDEAPTMRDNLSATLGGAGGAAGNAIAADIASSLSARSYSINVRANVTGLPVNRNASAMTAGRIYSKATVFGAANGALQIAGDAGPEAVIGTHSLAQLIQSAVNSAVGRSDYTTPRESKNITVVLNMDGREFARASVPYIDQERQRVGVKLATGGAY